MESIEAIDPYKLYTVREIAQLLGRNRGTVLYWIRNGFLSAEGYGKFRILGKDLIQFYNTQFKHRKYRRINVEEPRISHLDSNDDDPCAVGFVAWVLKVNRGTVLYWINKGMLRAEGSGKFLIKGPDLVKFYMKKHWKHYNNSRAT